MYCECTIAQAPVLIVPLLHETGAVFYAKIRIHHNRNTPHQSCKIAASVHYLIAPAFFKIPPPRSRGFLNSLIFYYFWRRLATFDYAQSLP